MSLGVTHGPYKHWGPLRVSRHCPSLQSMALAVLAEQLDTQLRPLLVVLG